MSGISGFSNQKKLGTSQFQSVIPVGSNKNASPTPQLYLTELVPNPIAISDVVVSDDQKKVFLEITGHSARIADVLRFTSGSLIGWEFDICEVIDADTLAIWNIGDDNDGNNVVPTLADEAKTYRWVTATSSPDGALTVSPGPVKFVDGTEKTVTPAEPLPVTNALTVKEYSTYDTTVNPIDGSTWAELISSTVAQIKKIQFFVPSGTPLYVGIGPTGSEVETALIAPGGWDVEISIPAGSTVSLKTVSGTVNDGLILANCLG